LGKSTIEVQVEKIFKHTRQNSFGTRARYKDSCLMFVRFCLEKFKMQNIRNLHDKHVAAFVKARQEDGTAPATIKNDLSALRLLHDQVQKPRYILSDNKQLQVQYGFTLEKTRAVNGDRSWTQSEYEAMKAIALQFENPDLADCLTLARTMGFRVTEAAAVSRSQAEHALRTGMYQVKGEAKNGKHREVPISPEVKKIFERRLLQTARGRRLFIQPGEKTHRVVNRMEKFVEYHRDKVLTTEGESQRVDLRDGSTRALTFHGLRYYYIQDRMEQELSRGFNHDQAALIVSHETGHERIDVIKIYLGGKGE
jgi:integrase